MATKRKQSLGPLQLEWLRCLESGEFKQTTHTLYQLRGDEYRNCCLGVACQVAQANGCRLKFTPRGDEFLIDNYSSVSMPPRVVRQMKFRSDCGSAVSKKNSTSLMTMNDNGFTFKEIAAEVRKDPSWYFTEPA